MMLVRSHWCQYISELLSSTLQKNLFVHVPYTVLEGISTSVADHSRFKIVQESKVPLTMLLLEARARAR